MLARTAIEWCLFLPPTVVILLAVRAYETPYESDNNDTAGNVTHIPAFGPNQRIPIFVGGFFLLPENSNFSALPATVQKAVDHVNDLTGILDGYELRMRGSLTNVSVIFNG